MQPTILKNIKKLRKITSASVMECKKAIIFSKGNINLGISYLIHKSNKQARTTRTKTKFKRNFILCRRNKTKTKIIAIILSTETDFVTKNDLFQKLSTFILEVACLCNNKSELLKYKINNLSLFQIITYFSKSIIQENIEFKTFVFIKSSFLNFYIYHNFNKAAIIGFSNYLPGIEYISKYLAMQLVANENKINTYVRNNIINLFNLKHIIYKIL
ncbi:hypothetical protein ONB76_00095 [Candidatus Karelsulcia muelleri]|uniref:hypothetical protein n=1 Tax=Candidatus Karelsulcia muelleri TaxID=336810 RepID=UPI00236872F7|nr:hypothetical protein [Candidatus Karelsulcia muelleri]WDI79513.1 hypothetical protein ONB75_00720 [Candidatus Karelsulcia muelleri]WDR78971.1 hypothetical protein ONB76_00095 [Candidatus Karelsulcia muelleri]